MSKSELTTSETEKPPPKRRRWLSFRLTTLFILVTIVAIAAAYPHIRRQVQLWRLQSYVGHDLRTLADSERWQLGRIIKSLQDPVDQIFFDKSFHPQTCWRLWRTEVAGETRFVLLQHSTTNIDLSQYFNSGVARPGNSKAIVLLYDSQGKRIDSWVFATGWHIDQIEANLVADRDLGEPILCIHNDYGAPEEIAKQYYAFVDDECVLVRLENGTGEAVCDRYVDPGERLGPEPPLRTKAEWITALSDQSKSETLRTLTWLSGGASDNSNPEGKLILEVRQDPTTQAVVAELIGSDDAWIREAARLALERMNSRSGVDTRKAGSIP